MTVPANRSAPIRTDASNPFAHRTIRERIPVILAEVLHLNPDYSAPIRAAVERLSADLVTDAPVPMVSLPAPDADEWAAQVARHAGDTWQNTDWFFAETYVYRLLMQAVRWWETGRDPFAPKKAAEIASPTLWTTLESALATRGLPQEQRLAALILHDLWGNRIDLSYAISQSHGSAWTNEDLLVDHHAAAVEHLLSKRGGDVHLVHDNTGTELAVDFALADALLDTVANRVIMHVKIHPTFVSDAIVPDIWHLLDSMPAGEPRALRDRLVASLESGRLRLAPDAYWNSSYHLWELPIRLERLFEGATLVIIKGDANYRRIVGDILWPPETPLADIIPEFPAPLLALRTLKSDPVSGLAPDLAAKLDSIDAHWRINGRRGLVQASW